jgi:hypothetical protein
MSESTLQTKVIKYLKSKQCDAVLKLTPMPGIPTGFPDILFLKDGFWGCIELKASRTAPFRPLQPEWLKRLDKASWARACYPENWQNIKAELNTLL